MPTYNTTAATGVAPRTAGPAGTAKTMYASFSLTAALALNDVIDMFKVPAGARITGIALKTSDLDTGGSPAIILDVGDAADTDRLIDGANIGQAGGTSTSLVSSTGQFYQYTAETMISVLVQVAPATGAATGTVELAVTYILP